MTEYHILPTQRLSGVVRVFESAPAKRVTLQSPALDIMTDLRHSHVATIEPNANIDLANLYMKQRGVRSLFVLNDNHTLRGVITATDILGEKPVRFNQERHLKRSEILVSDIMTPLNSLEAISIDDVRHAKVGHIIASLRDAGRQHTLVMDRENDGSLIICGIFSLTQIEKQLGQAIPLTEVAKTFAEIETTVVSN
ncbi:CBS domain-containing protein [Nitrosomonas sp. Nm51]|uniref:CBS domain-containing protein n=1 Tax=Nitrosomonas sp. Nm51 TaxID=133720 RepID=UPI0008B8C95B|nr:CBS domain-containing protein [Nitrosomonas sp. Nm51]SER68716.1 CBS domain-containing protein [Nitrosomonas sp. Nm51]